MPRSVNNTPCTRAQRRSMAKRDVSSLSKGVKEPSSENSPSPARTSRPRKAPRRLSSNAHPKDNVDSPVGAIPQASPLDSPIALVQPTLPSSDKLTLGEAKSSNPSGEATQPLLPTSPSTKRKARTSASPTSKRIRRTNGHPKDDAPASTPRPRNRAKNRASLPDSAAGASLPKENQPNSPLSPVVAAENPSDTDDGLDPSSKQADEPTTPSPHSTTVVPKKPVRNTSRFWIMRPGTQPIKPRQRFGDINAYLNSFVTIGDYGNVSPADAEQKVLEQAALQNKISQLTQQGRLRKNPPSLIPADRSMPTHPKTHHNHLLEHMRQWVKWRHDVVRERTARQRRITKAVEKYWGERLRRRERQEKVEQDQLRRLAKWTAKQVTQRWLAIKSVLLEKQAALEAEQQEKEGQEALMQMLEQSSKMLQSQQVHWGQVPPQQSVTKISSPSDLTLALSPVRSPTPGSKLHITDSSPSPRSPDSDALSPHSSESSESEQELADLQDEQDLPLEVLLQRYSGYLEQGTLGIPTENKDDQSLVSKEVSRSLTELYDDTLEPSEGRTVTFTKDEEDDIPQPPTAPDLKFESHSPQLSPPPDTTITQATGLLDGTPGSSIKLEESPVVDTPFLLRGTLRDYQKEGLAWLVNLYHHRLSGILADEMGLGKTIQTIALLAHLACYEEIWGPHLIVVPTSVLLNWEREFHKWLPGFKILTYFGNPKERKEKRKGWSKPNSFHVCITSYQLALQDQAVLRRKQWQYLILDEAHHIKNFRSKRWQTLMGFHSKNRLLLTGTPLQNNLGELWSLLYFLMPGDSLPASGSEQTVPDLPLESPGFASLQDFRQWFSRPIEHILDTLPDPTLALMGPGLAKADTPLARLAHQTVQQLHTILRPYLLRRLKSQVEHQLPQKHEHVIYCPLSRRQRFLYDDYMSRTTTRDTLHTGSYLSIIHCLMQLRKVCNHPDLFETRPIHTPWRFPRQYHPLVHWAPVAQMVQRLWYSSSSCGSYQAPDRDWLFRSLFRIVPFGDDAVGTKSIEDGCQTRFLARATGVTVDVQMRTVRGATSKYLQLLEHGRSMHQLAYFEQQQRWLRLAKIQAQRSRRVHNVYHGGLQDLCRRLVEEPIIYSSDQNVDGNQTAVHYHRLHYAGYMSTTGARDGSLVNDVLSRGLWTVPYKLLPRLEYHPGIYNSTLRRFSPPEALTKLPTPWETLLHNSRFFDLFLCLVPRVMIYPTVDPYLLSAIPPVPGERTGSISSLIPIPIQSHVYQYTSEGDRRIPVTQEFVQVTTAVDSLAQLRTRRALLFPDKTLLQYDCGKLQILATLLQGLAREHHRVLIFTQMTRVLDILEEFLNLHGYRYLRLDGATPVALRWDLTERFNQDRRIFAFISSTRAGGLGINLTGADTVIFYDSDWNPFMDLQCQDRAHRIGQTRDVHIYRLISTATIEENILRKANQKRALDHLVLQEGRFHTDCLRKVDWKEVVQDVLEHTNDSQSAEAGDEGEVAEKAVDQPEWSQTEFETALEAADEESDALALQQAQNEMNQLDWEDFGDASQSAAHSPSATSPARHPTDVAPPGGITSETEPGFLDGWQPDNHGSDLMHVGHVDDYMFKFLADELGIDLGEELV
ncbi:swr1 complex component [Dispira parvispora]|uniref:Swr1 complex component n=1 Tax=Dispira parvispora TaxID=1520584 RepID=A0A9W8E7S7_9FUNG|nr:swr1 complex component [Dispira parvispora]